MSAKKVFISYSHDSESHKKWVRELATYLCDNGIEVILDQWDIDLGDDTSAFIEDAIKISDRVLVICTDAYVHKANNRVGGVGYEKTLLAAEALRNCRNRRRAIPIIRDVKGTEKTPTFLSGGFYLDLSKGKDCNKTRKKLVESINEVPPLSPVSRKVPWVPQQTPPHVISNLLLSPGQEAIMEFSNRFAQAFPGVRDVQWFDEPRVIAECLGILLSKPLVLKEGNLAWWWRGPENFHIDRFEHVEGHRFQMNYHELIIRRMAAVNRKNIYNRKFVYIETYADSPTGLYSIGDEDIAREVREFGYCCEEYGLVDDNLPITRAEYDDGATEIDGAIVDVTGRVVLRIRYITPYNFLIAPRTSPINNNDFDYELKAFLNQMLQGKGSFSEICDAIDVLPKQN